MALSWHLVPQLFREALWGCREEGGGGFPVATSLSFSPVNKALLLAKVFSCYESKVGSRVSSQHSKALPDL